MDIVHKYKGFEIKKIERYYFQGTEICYVIKGISEEVFYKLKDAKSYIDRLGGGNDK